MNVPVVTAVTGTSWEATLVANLEQTPTDITVVRRCVDLADLLAVAAIGTARAVLLSAELRRLDRDAVARLREARLAVVGLVAPGDETAQHHLAELGVHHLVATDASPAAISDAVTCALAELSAATATSYADPLRSFFDAPSTDSTAEPVTAEAPSGRLVAVWGPTGAPGRTTVALGIATELAHAGVATVLADADVYGGMVAALLGFLDEAPGLAAAARMSNNGQLDLASLAQVAPVAAPGLRVLSGISRPSRWPELRPSAVERVWTLCRSLAAVTIVDCAFCLEQDEELSFDTAAPRRNGLTLLTLEQADVVLAVGSADPIGMQRLIRGLSDLRDAVPHVNARVVLNRVRSSATGPDPRRQLRAALERYTGTQSISFVPYDRGVLDAAELAGRALHEVAPRSGVRLAIADLAAGVVDGSAPARRRRFRNRRPEPARPMIRSSLPREA